MAKDLVTLQSEAVVGDHVGGRDAHKPWGAMR